MKKLLFLLFLPAFIQGQSLDWQVQDKAFSIGDTVSAEFVCYNFDSLTAYQFAMLYDTGALKFVGVEFPSDNPMELSDGCFSWHGKPGYNVKPKELRHLRSMPYGETYADGTHGFSYIFIAKQNSTLSQKMTLATCCLSPPLNPMSYRYLLTWQPLTVAYVSNQEEIANTNKSDIENKIAVYPNPANGYVWIECPTLSEVKIFDFSGMLTHQAEMQVGALWGLHAGVNLIWINSGNQVVLKTVISE